MEVVGKGESACIPVTGKQEELTRGFRDDTESLSSEGGGPARRGGEEQEPGAAYILSLSAHGEETKPHKTSLRPRTFSKTDTTVQAATQYNGMG